MDIKLAIPSTGSTPESEMDERFGRAAAFMILDLETGQWQAIDNRQEAAAAHGAGTQAAQTLIDNCVSVVLTADCGPKASQVLAAAGVEVRTGFSGSVKEVAKQYKESLA